MIDTIAVRRKWKQPFMGGDLERARQEIISLCDEIDSLNKSKVTDATALKNAQIISQEELTELAKQSAIDEDKWYADKG